MKTFISCITLLLFHGFIFAQSVPTGLWEGYITVGGLDSDVGYKFELQLEGNGKRLKGRSYIQMGDQKVIMDVAGKMYKDRSVYLREVRFIESGDGTYKPKFKRKYQLVYRRSLYEKSIEGYWQEIRPDSESEKRERGRIVLKRIDEKKSKA